MKVRYAPAFLLRAYIWRLLEHNLGWSKVNYGGLVPIVPVAEEPDITQYDHPYIVYGWASVPPVDNQHFRQRGSMSMVIYSTKFTDIVDALTVIENALGREDLSAADVNNFTGQTPQFVGLRFGTIKIGFGEGPAPEGVEGGRQSGLVNLQFDYFVDYDIDTNLSPA